MGQICFQRSGPLTIVLCLTGLTLLSSKLHTNSKDGRTAGAGGVGGGGLSARLEKELERTLREFVRMKTVSSDPSLREECFRGAKYLAHLLESLGTIVYLSDACVLVALPQKAAVYAVDIHACGADALQHHYSHV